MDKFIDILRAIRDTIYPDVLLKHTEVVDSTVAAAGSATTASDKADEASASAIAAAGSATTASDKAGEASASASAAAGSATTASDKADEASASESKASKWADEAEDVEVEAGKYSARHWALKAYSLVTGGMIDDGAITNLKTWSSDKINTVIGSVVESFNSALGGKADSAHNHAISDVTGLGTALDGKAASSHAHAISDVTGLGTALDGKAASSHAHEISDVTGFDTALNAKQATLVSGANIKTVQGQSLIGSGDITIAVIGVNQTWQDVTASRSTGTTYTNTTGKPIVVSYASSGTTPTISITVNGIVVANVIDSAGTNLWVSAIIPNGNTYIVNCSDTTGQSWKELR